MTNEIKKHLTRANPDKKCWYFVKGKRIEGVPSDVSGDVSEIPMDARKEHPNIADWVETSTTEK